MAASSDSPAPALPQSAPAAWAVVVRLLVRWIEKHERADALLEDLPRALPKSERGRVQHLLFGALRHQGRIEAQIQRLIPRPPRTRLRAVLWVAGFELIEGGSDGHAARVVHHAVEQAKTLASPAEARLVNAVVRKLAAALAAQTAPARLASADELAEFFSHPVWLVQRWLETLGAASTRALLELNQTPAAVHGRWRDPESAAPDWLTPTTIPGYFVVPSGRWPDVEALLQAGKLYLHDPATRHAVGLLAPKPGETVLDVCAAPGGKSLLIADTMREGRVVAFDLPGDRIERLKENLSRAGKVEVALVQGDILKGAARLLTEHTLPTEYPAVLIDVPCSNTGVMRHRVDVKWRLQEGDFSKHARQQLALLSAASRFVAVGGRIVYSTCSVDSEENQQVVEAFLGKAGAAFTLEDQVISRPWETGHDGAGAFRLRRLK